MGREEAIEWGRRFRATEAIELVRLGVEVEDEAWGILESHADKRWSYVDATSFALIERHGGGEAFAFDTHFSQRGLRVSAGSRDLEQAMRAEPYSSSSAVSAPREPTPVCL